MSRIRGIDTHKSVGSSVVHVAIESLSFISKEQVNIQGSEIRTRDCGSWGLNRVY